MTVIHILKIILTVLDILMAVLSVLSADPRKLAKATCLGCVGVGVIFAVNACVMWL